ncbi:pilus assembly protein [Alicycliphilus denitrificans]|uniref:pilus assembly protein n=1 Tax=Alicycliphilus denitrificans TaxID=179636 RepID=UPI001915E92C|nr:PilC/PilY family type IV pilus protein [Alicycliphilus denitrificans]MBN9574662.1 hypothetical protein [Alicycliphilus denitrificans]
MRTARRPQRTALAILIAAIGTPGFTWAAPLTLAQYPAGTAYKAPIPNVILTVDTSGSMGTTDSGQSKNRLAYVIEGLKGTLVNSSKYDDQLRLAWQSFTCNDIPSNNGNCDGNNAIGKFSGTHKANFGTWVSKLKTGTSPGTTNTPSHMVVWNAGEYLKTTGSNSPWNANPGTTDNNPLTCRRAYHIFLTDGGWNYSNPSTYYPSNPPSKAGAADGFSFNTKIKTTDPLAQAMQNADGKATTFPDGTDYTVTSTNVQTQVYRDAYGADRIIKNASDKIEYAYPSLADMAFYYWATDLQQGISDGVIKKIRKSGQETFTSTLPNGTQKSVAIDEYWNPKNNPATWQHLVQYTIGYGSAASNLKQLVATSPQFTGGTYGMYNSGFSDLITGKTTWDDPTSTAADASYDNYRPQEMWHMAINSRGKFYPVSGGDLTSVFSDIFDDIIVDTTAPITGFTSASGSVSRVGTQSYQTSYTAADDANSNDDRWYGHVTSDSISTSGSTSPNPDWGTNASTGKNSSTADKLNAITAANLDDRLILTYDKYNATPQGVSFKWANLTDSTTGASQRMWLNKGTVGTGTTAQIATAIAGDGKGENRLNFIRGDRTKEASQSGGEFRNRKSRQGDIVNSAIWYVGAPATGHTVSSYKSFASTHRGRLSMLYVGGNDGMLHGFSAKDGSEKIAYIPHGVVQNLAALADTNYTHKYYVDGSPFSGDIDIGTTSADWRTYLVGTLGAGGRGYFVLDVTKPGADPSFTGTAAPASDFTETNAPNLVVMDKTAAAAGDAAPPGKPADPNADPDIGHIFGNPVVAESNQQRAMQITRTNNGRWALITGNGYNSVNERPVLLIQYLDGDKSLKKIIAADKDATPTVNASEAVGNGLSTPQFLDVNGDGTPDFVYAGDLRGNMWKFDISSGAATDWNVAFNGSPLFTAIYSSGTGSSSRQPITAPPVLRPNRTVGGLMVAFGTGQNLTENDRADTSVQTVYSVLDNTRYEIENTGSNKGKVKVKTSSPTPATVSGRSELQAESVTGGTGSGTAGAGASAGRSFWKLSSTEVVYSCDGVPGSCTARKGWYMDLPVAGERVTTSFDFYDGGNILEIISEKPASGSATASGEEVCAPQPQAAKPFRTLINIASGSPAKPPIMDVNGDGVYKAADDGGYARMTASSKELRFGTKDKQVRQGNDGKVDKLAKLPELMLRPGWRQLK